MAQITIPASATDANSPGDQTLMDALRLNATDHETRMAILEAQNDTRIRSHFAKRTQDSVTLVGGGTGSTVALFDRDWRLTTETDDASHGITQDLATHPTEDNHFLRLIAGTDEVRLHGLLALYYNNRTKPLRFYARCRLETHANISMGFTQWPVIGTFKPTSGIFMEPNGTNWRFVSGRDSSYTNGSDFTRIALDTWFTVEIIWDETGGGQARCYLDGVLKETLSTTLPVDRLVYGFVTNDNCDDLDVDEIDISAGGIVNSGTGGLD